MVTIQVEGMEFYAFHGHYKEEQVVGNKFIVDLTLETNKDLACKSDKLEDALNYAEAYQLVKNQMETKSHLLEHIAQRILDSLYETMEGISKATIKISKLNPPVGGQVSKVSVTLSR